MNEKKAPLRKRFENLRRLGIEAVQKTSVLYKAAVQISEKTA